MINQIFSSVLEVDRPCRQVLPKATETGTSEGLLDQAAHETTEYWCTVSDKPLALSECLPIRQTAEMANDKRTPTRESPVSTRVLMITEPKRSVYACFSARSPITGNLIFLLL